MLRRLLAAAVVAPGLAWTGEASAANWLPPVPLSGGSLVVTPGLATAGTGSAVAIWDREVGSVCPDQPANPACVHVVEARSRSAAGAGWDPPVEIARPGVGSEPQVALDARGDAIVLWSHDIGVDRVLQASVRRGSTGTWPEPVDLSEPSPSIGAHAVALDARGDAFAVWVDAIGVNAAIRPSDSGVWSSPAHLSRPGSAAPTDLKLAVDDAGDAVVVWSAGGIVQAASAAVGIGPAVDVGIGTSPAAALGPFGGRLVVWTARGTVFASARRWDGWTAPRALGTGAQPAVAFDADSNAVVAWSDAATIEALYIEAYSPFPRPVDKLGRGSEPQVALTAGGNAVATWLDGGVRAALRPAASGLWLPAVAISADGASDVRLRSNGTGADVLWSRGGRVETAEFVAPGPLILPLDGPPDGLVGDSLPFAVQAVPWASPLSGDPAWTFGDGASATGGFVEHAYAAAGTYQVTVTQADAAGGAATATTTVTIRVAKPIDVSPPTVRGRPRVGAKLTCARGRWEGTPPLRFAYAWLRGGRTIRSSRRPTYTIRPADRGRALACRVTASNSAGRATSTSRAVRVARRGS